MIDCACATLKHVASINQLDASFVKIILCYTCFLESSPTKTDDLDSHFGLLKKFPGPKLSNLVLAAYLMISFFQLEVLFIPHINLPAHV